jgi:hypothetical protein
MAFAGQSFLYKIYVVRQVSTTEESQETDPALEFLQALLPELQKSLFSS